MPTIFISYRREDAPDSAGRLYDNLRSRYGEGSVFIDVDEIQAGADFVKAIESAVTRSDVVIAVIGPGWLTATDARGRRRLNSQRDFVRLEINTALSHGVHIIPVLVQGAGVLPASDLPRAIRDLATRNAVELRYASWGADVGRLCRQLELVAGTEPTAEPDPPPNVASDPDPEPRSNAAAPQGTFLERYSSRVLGSPAVRLAGTVAILVTALLAFRMLTSNTPDPATGGIASSRSVEQSTTVPATAVEPTRLATVVATPATPQVLATTTPNAITPPPPQMTSQPTPVQVAEAATSPAGLAPALAVTLPPATATAPPALIPPAQTVASTLVSAGLAVVPTQAPAPTVVPTPVPTLIPPTATLLPALAPTATLSASPTSTDVAALAGCSDRQRALLQLGFLDLWMSEARVRALVSCPREAEIPASAAAVQYFENGALVFWRVEQPALDINSIYVFHGVASGHWDLHDANTLAPLDPGISCRTAGYAPVQGFAKLLGKYPGLAQELGNGGCATTQEISLKATRQEMERGRMLFLNEAPETHKSPFWAMADDVDRTFVRYQR